MNKALFFLVLFLSADVLGQDVTFVKGSTLKIEQLIGDWDKERQILTNNQTQSNYGLGSTDLGVPFEHKGKTYIPFGDIPNHSDRDPIAYTTDDNIEDGLSLTFLTNPGGDYRIIDIPGETMNTYEVPMEGVSWNSIMYLYCTTDFMERSFLAKSTDDGLTFTKLYDLSSSKFINVSLVKTKSTSDYPEPEGTDIQVMVGSGKYRESDVYLAYQRADQIETKPVYYFAGLENGRPSWTPYEFSSVPLFEQACVGELSISYNSFINKWILLYNCETPRGINCRTANNPWGPWSAPFVIFEPWENNGYCHFIHTSWEHDVCDNVHDNGRENEWGGEYGPYQFEDYATGLGNETTIYYTMSTWNPYTVVLMKSTLRLNSSGLEERNPSFSKFELFPNPAIDILYLKLHTNDVDYYLIRNSVGQIVKEGTLRNSTLSQDILININNLEPGIYFMEVVKDISKINIEKFIITEN